MSKRVTLKLYEGTLAEGFSAILQLGDEGKSAVLELPARLPPAPALEAQFQQWQAAYRQQDSLCSSSRIMAVETGLATNVAIAQDCNSAAEKLGALLNEWLCAASFRPIRDKLLERLNPHETTQLVLQTQDAVVQRLPWHLWEMCSLYSALEIALSAPVYDSAAGLAIPKHPCVRILAIFGNNAGLDTQTDQTLLKALPNAEIHYLHEPDRPTLDACIWDEQGWDILFFAGHSATHEGVGELSINATETITIPQLKHALRKAVSRGLKIALFNSCDGLGLAKSLSDLRLSQIVVMREVVADKVAHTFLKSFLEAFSRGEPLYLAVREAREKLSGLESEFPCASWLPIIYQNPAEMSPSWRSLYLQSPNGSTDKTHKTSRRLPLFLLTQAGVAIALLAIQSLGWFQALELKVFDQLMRLRPKEDRDPRIVVVQVTEEDVRSQPGAEERVGSLSDEALLAALTQLASLAPRLIGLDIYRDFPVRADQPVLKTMLADTENLRVVCKGSDEPMNEQGLPPPPEVPPERVGFSDIVRDSDGILRRQLLGLTQAPSSPCQSGYNLSTLLALGYLAQEGIGLQTLDKDTIQLGDVKIDLLGANDGGYHGIDPSGSQLLLNYRSLNDPAEIAEQVTLANLLAGDVREEAIRDRIVLIGTTANSFKDSEPTPYSRGLREETQTKGVFLQAQMVSQLLSVALDGRSLLKTPSPLNEVLWLIAWTGAGGLIAFYCGQRQRNTSGRVLLALLVTELGLLGLCWLLLSRASYWVPWVPSAIAPVAVVVADKAIADKTVVRKSEDT